MTAEQYQRVRLWAGITSIGANLGAIWMLAISALWWAPLIPSTGGQLAVLGLLALVLMLINLPFEILLGHALETAVGRTRQSFRAWLGDWLRQSARAGATLSFGLLFFWGHHFSGGAWSWPLLGGAFVVMLLVVLFVPQGVAALPGSVEDRFALALAGELARLHQPPSVVRWFDNSDEESVNGYLVPWRAACLCLATTVARHLTPREAALLAAREGWFRRSGATARAVCIAVGWLMTGVGAGLFIPADSALQAALLGAAVVTTWCFAALFIWPTLNRSWMRHADLFLLTLAPREEVRALLEKLQRLNATDVSLPAGKTAVFHPIPPLTSRLEALS